MKQNSMSQGGLSDTRSASILGINRSQLYRARNGYSAVGAGLLEGFMTAYPDLDVREYFEMQRQDQKELH